MAREGQSLECPGCGAPIELENRFVKLAVCQYCQQTVHVTKDGVDPTGKTAQLTDFGSVLTVGARGSLRGESFKAVGRLRFEYEDGYWDEWYLVFESGRQAWLHEDEGELTLLQKKRITTALPPVAEIRVGSTIPVNELQVFVTERNTATIAGGQGQLTMRVRPGAELQYIDGNAQGKIVMLEYTEDEIELCIGDPVEFDEIEVEGEEW